MSYLFYDYHTNKIEHRGHILKFIGAGRHREVYLMPDNKWVLKIPINEDGYDANISEAYQYRKEIKQYPNKIDRHFARCKLISSGLLLMEYVDTCKLGNDKPELPQWVYAIDCCQVGYTSDGRLVAYDYSII